MKINPSTHPVNQVPLLDVTRSNDPLHDQIIQSISDLCRSGRFIGGPTCQEFERKMAEACDTEFAIGCASGSDALLLALMAVDIGPGDEVIVPSFTFFATVSAVWRLGAKPVFVDINPYTFNMDPKLLSDVVTSKTKAIIPVHLFGQCAVMDEINEFAKPREIFVIEDAAQSIGATYDRRLAGSIGDIGCFSFYPTKNLGAFGDAGAITTNDKELADKLRLLANHGMQPRYCHQLVGINSRLDAIQAMVLSIKLDHLKQYETLREQNAVFYTNRITAAGLDSSLIVPPCNPRCGHVWNQYTVRVANDQRDKVRDELTKRGVGSEVYYPIPMHMQPCFQTLGYKEGSLPVTEQAAREVLSLPIFPELTDPEKQMVVDSLAEALFHQRPLKMAS